MVDVMVWTGAIVKALREAAHLTQEELARQTKRTQRTISCWERNPHKEISPTGSRELDRILYDLPPHVGARFQQLLDTRVTEVVRCGIDDGMRRRHFLRAAALASWTEVIVSESDVAELMASLAGGDSQPLASVQTSNAIDHALATDLDGATARTMLRWAENDPSEIVRVNAAGILAKAANPPAEAISRILQNDHDVRLRYTTAVIARVLGIDHEVAASYVIAPETMTAPTTAAQRLAQEAITLRDVGARWCASTMLARMTPLLP